MLPNRLRCIVYLGRTATRFSRMIYEFGGFELDTARVELRHGEEILHLEAKAYELLLLLVQHPNRVVAKDEILEAIWPGVYVTEASLSGSVKQVRRALGDDGKAQKFIKTVRGKGFRFIAPVSQTAPLQAANPEPAPANEAPNNNNFHGQPVIAVLPFAHLGANETHDAIAEAIPIEIIIALSKLRAVAVIARGSSFRFKPLDFDIDEVQQRLGVMYVLSGSVELRNGRLTVIAELASTKTHNLIWSDRFEGSIDDVFLLRQKIVEAVANAVEFHVPLNEASLKSMSPTENIDAWGHYHLGIRNLHRFTGSQNDKAAECFLRAIELDPGFARAHAGLSYSELDRRNLWQGSQNSEHFSNSLRYAEKAVEIDPLDPFCNVVLGQAKWIGQNLDEAINFAERSVHLNPNYAFGHYNCSKLHAISCNGSQADSHIETSLHLSPIDPNLQSMLSACALSAFAQDDRERAIDFADRSSRAENAHIFVLAIAAAIFAAYDASESAERVRTKIARLDKRFEPDHFSALFTLRDPERNAAMVEGLTKMGLRQ